MKRGGCFIRLVKVQRFRRRDTGEGPELLFFPGTRVQGTAVQGVEQVRDLGFAPRLSHGSPAAGARLMTFVALVTEPYHGMVVFSAVCDVAACRMESKSSLSFFDAVLLFFLRVL